MDQQTDTAAFAQLVAEAQQGDKMSMSRLAEEAEQRVRAYIHRVTLDHDLTEELLQQTLLKMVELLEDLREPTLFWPWLFRTALGTVQHHYRAQGRQRRLDMSALNREQTQDRLARQQDDGLTFAARRELTGIIFQTMSQLKLNYRNVVVLRCVEGMSYNEIADVLGCKELHARVLFFRARHALRRRLSQRGLREGLLLTALGLFRLATSHARSACAAGPIKAAYMDVGLLATVIGALGTRLGIALTAVFGFLAAGLALEIFVAVVVALMIVLLSSAIVLYLEWS
jgi:RNA polymerase sigma-70 factor (ECF subfamily)